MSAPRQHDLHSAACYIKQDGGVQRQLRVYLPEDRVKERWSRWLLQDWDGKHRVRVHASWVDYPHVLDLTVSKEERRPRGERQPGNALTHAPTENGNEGCFYVSLSDQQWMGEELLPFAQTICEAYEWTDDRVRLTLCPNGALYTRRMHDNKRGSGGTSAAAGGMPSSAAFVPLSVEVIQQAPPCPWDHNLVDMLGMPEPEELVDLRAALGLLKECTDKLRLKGLKVQVSLDGKGNTKATVYPEVLARFIALGRWSVTPDAPLDTIKPLSLELGHDTLPPRTEEK